MFSIDSLVIIDYFLPTPPPPPPPLLELHRHWPAQRGEKMTSIEALEGLWPPI